jgi:hypothetical protein
MKGLIDSYVIRKAQDEFLYSRFWGYFHAGNVIPRLRPTPTTTFTQSGVPCVTYSLLKLLLVSRIIRRPDRYRSEGLICLACLGGCCKNLVYLPVVAPDGTDHSALLSMAEVELNVNAKLRIVHKSRGKKR